MEELALDRDRDDQVVCGQSYAVLRGEDGTLALSGHNGKTRFTSVATSVPVAQAACNGSSAIILLEDGKVKILSRYLVLEDLLEDVLEPLQVVQVACGRFHTFLLYENGTVAAWGRNDHGQLGLGDATDRFQVTPVPTSMPVVQVICGDYYTFLLFEDGTVAACGYNWHGQLGLARSSDHLHFTRVDVSSVIQVACGNLQTLFRFEDGSIAGCGNNYHGQLGLRDRVSLREIRPVPTTQAIASITTSGTHSFLRFEDGSIAGCGSNYGGQLGLRSSARDVEVVLGFTPVAVPSAVAQVACSDSYTFVRLERGTLLACGENYSGQLGLGDYVTRRELCALERLGDPTRN